ASTPNSRWRTSSIPSTSIHRCAIRAAFRSWPESPSPGRPHSSGCGSPADHAIHGGSLMLVRLARMLGVQAGEGSPVAWLVAHSMFNGVFSALFLTAANALFLARFPIRALPLAYIAAALVGYAAVWLLSRLERRANFAVLRLVNLGVLVALVTAFW